MEFLMNFSFRHISNEPVIQELAVYQKRLENVISHMTDIDVSIFKSTTFKTQWSLMKLVLENTNADINTLSKNIDHCEERQIEGMRLIMTAKGLTEAFKVLCDQIESVKTRIDDGTDDVLKRAFEIVRSELSERHQDLNHSILYKIALKGLEELKIGDDGTPAKYEVNAVLNLSIIDNIDFLDTYLENSLKKDGTDVLKINIIKGIEIIHLIKRKYIDASNNHHNSKILIWVMAFMGIEERLYKEDMSTETNLLEKILEEINSLKTEEKYVLTEEEFGDLLGTGSEMYPWRPIVEPSRLTMNRGVIERQLKESSKKD